MDPYVVPGFIHEREHLFFSADGLQVDASHCYPGADVKPTTHRRAAVTRHVVFCVFVFVQPCRNPVRTQDLKILCAENEQTRTCWTSAFRLFKVNKTE